MGPSCVTGHGTLAGSPRSGGCCKAAWSHRCPARSGASAGASVVARMSAVVLPLSPLAPI
eukprot:1527659-Alexandrium_andersonii.AAC.1